MDKTEAATPAEPLTAEELVEAREDVAADPTNPWDGEFVSRLLATIAARDSERASLVAQVGVFAKALRDTLISTYITDRFTPQERPVMQCAACWQEGATESTIAHAPDCLFVGAPAAASALLQEVDRLRLERDEAREQFDRHVAWASDQSQAAEARVKDLEAQVARIQAKGTAAMEVYEKMLAEADAVAAYAVFDERWIDKRAFNQWADAALERYRARKKEREDNGQFGVGA